MTTEKMNELFVKAIQMCENDGYVFPDGFNRHPGLNRRKKSYGLCTRRYDYFYGAEYNITFSKYFVQSCKDNEFMNTAIHELGHVLYWKDGHKGEWKHFAERMNKKHGLNVSRTNRYTNDENKEIVQANSIGEGKEYILRCKKCGELIIRHRMSKVIAYPEMFHHVDDNGQLERIK